MKNEFITIKNYGLLITFVHDVLKEYNCDSENIHNTIIYNLFTNMDKVKNFSKDEIKEFILETKIQLEEFYLFHNIKNDDHNQEACDEQKSFNNVCKEMNAEKADDNKDEQKTMIIDYKEIKAVEYGSMISHVCPICGAVIQISTKVFNFEEFTCEECGCHVIPKYKVDTIYPDLFFVMVKYSIHGDKRVDRGEIKSFDDLMKYIYSFNNIETVKISTGINEKSLDIPGRYFEYKPRDYARDYISNLLLHKVTYNH